MIYFETLDSLLYLALPISLFFLPTEYKLCGILSVLITLLLREVYTFLRSTSSSSDKGYSRIYIPLFGIDILLLKDAQTIRKAMSSGDLVKIDGACPDINDVQWLIRNFFSNSRFYSEPFGYFMAMRENGSMPTKLYLETKFRPGTYDLSNYAKQATDILLNKNQDEMSYKALQDVFCNAIGSRFMPGGKPYDANILDEARVIIPNLVKSLNPAKHLPSRKAVEKVCFYIKDELEKTGDVDKYKLPRNCPIDLAHPIFAGTFVGGNCLRALAEDPGQDVEVMMCRRDGSDGRVKNVPRMVTKDSTLGGLLPTSKPAYAGKTAILLQIGKAAKETNNISFAFGTGSMNRRCPAEPAILEFLKAVQTELKSRTLAEELKQTDFTTL